MTTEQIDFISSYGDRSCERCAFTGRCANASAKVALISLGRSEASWRLIADASGDAAAAARGALAAACALA